MKLTPILSAIAGLCAALVPQSVSGQSVLIDFNSSTGIANTMTQATVNVGGTSSAYGNLSYSSSGGLGGAGGASTPVKFSDNYGYTSQTAFGSSSSSFTASSYFYLGSSWETGTSLVLNLGFTGAATASVGSGNDSGGTPYGTVGIPTSSQSSVITSLRFSGTAASPVANFTSYSNGATTGVTTSSSSASLSLSNWYYVETVFTPTSSTTLSVASTLYLSDSSGTIGSTALITHTATITNSTLLSSDLYGYVGSQNGNRRGVTTLDNLAFAAIPEPSSMTLILGSLAATGALARRRRN